MDRKIFEPLQINEMELKNRIGFAPMLNMPGIWTSFMITDETVKWFEERAKGGAGLIMTGTFGPFLLDIPGAMEGFVKLAFPPFAIEDDLIIEIYDCDDIDVTMRQKIDNANNKAAGNQSISYNESIVDNSLSEFVVKDANKIRVSSLIFDGKALVSLPFSDTDEDEYVDGTNERIQDLKAFYLNEETEE